jgi:hypothetical protein
MEQVLASFEQDTTCLNLLIKLSIDPHAIPKFSLQEGVLRHKGKLVIGDNTDLKNQLLESFHKYAFGGHSGERATLKRLQLIFYWPKMQQLVKAYVQTCPICQKNKSENTPYPGLLAPLTVPVQA